jgi:co-chaperonin GroES (HSP10)
MKPLHNKVIVERIGSENVSSGGIILHRSQEPDRAKVISVGPNVDEVSVGDVVLLDWNKTVKAGDYFVVTVDNIIFIYGE